MIQMAEYISREAIKQVLCGIANGLSIGEAEALKTKGLKALYKTQGAKEILNAIDNDLSFIPAADVQPIIHAHWIRGEEKGFRTYNPLWYCSNCGGQIRYDTRMRQYQKIKRPVWEVNAFCRKCGAKMEQE